METVQGLSENFDLSRPSAAQPNKPSGCAREAVAATEFAFILPLLLVIILGCIDLGRFGHTYIAVTNAARAGAEFAMMKPFTTGSEAQWQVELRQVVIDEMQQLMAADSAYDETDLIVEHALILEDEGFRRIRIRVQYPFGTLVPWSFLTPDDQRIDIDRTLVMRMIR